MAYFAFLPLAVLGVVAAAVFLVLLLVDRAERRRARIHPAAGARVQFRLVVIEGGLRDAPAPTRRGRLPV